MKQNQKFNPKLIFLGTLLLVITFAFIFASGCVTDDATSDLHQLQRHYLLDAPIDDLYVILDFPQAGIARVTTISSDVNCTTMWRCERNANTISGYAYQLYINDKLEVIQNPTNFEIEIINDKTLYFYLNDNFVILKST